MLKTKNYISFLVLEILCIPVVISIFKFVEPRKIAAVFAGSLFVSLGSFLVYKSFNAKKSLTLYAASIHLYFFALPMLAKRVFYLGSDFSEISFYGMSGPAFHKFSEKAFVILFLASLIDFLRLKFKKKISRVNS